MTGLDQERRRYVTGLHGEFKNKRVVVLDLFRRPGILAADAVGEVP
jgi:hypothetical protein